MFVEAATGSQDALNSRAFSGFRRNKVTMASVIERTAYPPEVRGGTLVGGFLAFLTFYILAFPKGGIKVGGVPLTIGYVLTILLLVFAALRSRRLSLPIDRLLAFMPCMALALWSALVISSNGTTAAGFTISYFVSVIYLPVFGMVFFSGLLLDQHYHVIERAVVWALRFIVIYGIFLFVFKRVTGSWIEIPYLTVNADDLGQLDDKFIDRGGIFKLISTYNNGNILGASLAIIAPLYLRLEGRRVFRWLLYAAMFLTLSRTAWIAAIIIIFMSEISKGIKPVSLLYLTVGLLAAGTVIVSLLTYLGLDMSFIFDKNLGGRADQLGVLNNISIIPQIPVSPLPEIAYLGMLKFFGVPGFLLFVLHLLLPVLILRFEGVQVLSTTRGAACLQGLLVYMVIAGADAAFSYIPVMMIFWMVAGLGFWYAHRRW